ncbi:hypothetical protein BGX28_005984 [Mortierella sp. GBA30]|nr:hypothetical protein BGX28_005984 [Mortierella sp. GBA30]
MKRSFLLLSIIAAISVVAAEAPAAQIAFNQPSDNVAMPDNFAFESNSQPILQGEKFQFQTEVSRLMNIVINSLYKTPEIFLRELISNGSDALDKIRFQSLTDASALETNPNLNVTIALHKDQRVITITDTGIGMTKEDLQRNLGTIAKSGTSEFLETMSGDKADMDLIGKFGVGFYSVFLVADKVRVTSKNNNDDQYVWESTAVDDFTIAKDPAGNTLGRGTQIAIHLKQDQEQYLDDTRIQQLVTKYSEFINFPIYIRRTKTKTVEPEAAPSKETEKEKDGDDSEEAQVEDAKEEEAKEKPAPVTVTYEEDDLMNTNKPIWIRDPKTVSESEYEDFYPVLTRDPGAKAMAHSHFKAEGDNEFRAIMYIPSKAPKDLFQRVDNVHSNVKLYVKRVFITDDSTDFLPRWLGFLKVVVDAEDAPLNVSRETVQSNKSIRAISKHLVKKLFDLLKSMSQDETKYADFIKEYGTSLKLGALEDKSNVKKISRLLRYRSSDSDDKFTSLESYVSRMKKGQKDIFYFTGANVDEIKQSPFVESLLARGYEVLYMDDPVDEIVLSHLVNFEGKNFQNVAKSDLKLGDEEHSAETEKELEQKFLPLLDWMQATLINDVEKVRVSKRLTTSPAALVANDFGWTANMERLMEGQAKQNKDQAMHQFMKSQKKILEINPGHPLILGMLDRAAKDPKAFEDDKHFQEMAKVLYDITLVRSGYTLKEGVKAFAGRVENMLRQNLGVDQAAEATFEAPLAEARDQEEVEAEIEKREDILDADNEMPGMMSAEELNKMLKEYTDSTNPPTAGPGGKQPEAVNVEEIVAKAEEELDSESPEEAKETVHDEL